MNILSVVHLVGSRPRRVRTLTLTPQHALDDTRMPAIIFRQLARGGVRPKKIPAACCKNPCRVLSPRCRRCFAISKGRQRSVEFVCDALLVVYQRSFALKLFGQAVDEPRAEAGPFCSLHNGTAGFRPGQPEAQRTALLLGRPNVRPVWSTPRKMRMKFIIALLARRHCAAAKGIWTI